jgi:hypothetical protein
MFGGDVHVVFRIIMDIDLYDIILHFIAFRDRLMDGNTGQPVFQDFVVLSRRIDFDGTLVVGIEYKRRNIVQNGTTNRIG